MKMLFYTLFFFVLASNLNEYVFLITTETTGRRISEATTNLSKTLLKYYDTSQRPMKNLSTRTSVYVHASVLHIEKVEEKSGTLSIHGIISLYWNDEFLTWKPGDYDGVTQIHLNPYEVWIPDIHVYNSVNLLNESVFGSQLKVTVSQYGSVTFSPTYHFSYSCKFDYSKYPNDVQRCPVLIGTNYYSSSQTNRDVDFVGPETTEFVEDGGRETMLVFNDTKTIVSGWTVLNVTHNSGWWNPVQDLYLWNKNDIRQDRGYFSFIAVTLELRRYSPYFSVTILLPLVLTSICTVIGFWVEKYQLRLGLLGATLILETLLIQNLAKILPPTVSAIPKISYYCTINQILTFLAISFCLAYANMKRFNDKRAIPLKLISALNIWNWIKTKCFACICVVKNYVKDTGSAKTVQCEILNYWSTVAEACNEAILSIYFLFYAILIYVYLC